MSLCPQLLAEDTEAQGHQFSIRSQSSGHETITPFSLSPEQLAFDPPFPAGHHGRKAEKSANAREEEPESQVREKSVSALGQEVSGPGVRP